MHDPNDAILFQGCVKKALSSYNADHSSNFQAIKGAILQAATTESMRLTLAKHHDKAGEIAALCSTSKDIDDFMAKYKKLEEALNKNRSTYVKRGETESFKNFRAVVALAIADNPQSTDPDIDLLIKAQKEPDWASTSYSKISDQIKRLGGVDNNQVNTKAKLIHQALYNFDSHPTPANALNLKNALNLHQKFSWGMNAQAWREVKDYLRTQVKSGQSPKF